MENIKNIDKIYLNPVMKNLLKNNYNNKQFFKQCMETDKENLIIQLQNLLNNELTHLLLNRNNINTDSYDKFYIIKYVIDFKNLYFKYNNEII